MHFNFPFQFSIPLKFEDQYNKIKLLPIHFLRLIRHLTIARRETGLNGNPTIKTDRSNKNKIKIECHGRQDHIFLRVYFHSEVRWPAERSKVEKVALSREDTGSSRSFQLAAFASPSPLPLPLPSPSREGSLYYTRHVHVQHRRSTPRGNAFTIRVSHGCCAVCNIIYIVLFILLFYIILYSIIIYILYFKLDRVRIFFLNFYRFLFQGNF